MIYSGDHLHNAAAGRRFMFLRTAQDTGGEYLRIKCSTDAGKGQCKGITHLHPYQTEELLVLSGQLAVNINGKKQIYQAGQSVCIYPGEAHKWWNASCHEKLHLVMEIRPAMQSEQLLESICALSQKRRLKRSGKPQLLHLAVLLDAYHDHYQLSGRGAKIKTAIFKAMALLGKCKGYKACYSYQPSIPRYEALEKL